jgi:hypothetical protein
MIKTLDDVRKHADDFSFTDEQYYSIKQSLDYTMLSLPEKVIWTYWTDGTLLKDISNLFYSLEDSNEQLEVAKFYWSVIELGEDLDEYSQGLGYPERKEND